MKPGKQDLAQVATQIGGKRLLIEQIKVFLITAFYYATFHASRTAWAYSKHDIKQKITFFDDNKLGILDMSFMLAYALGQFINGWLGDKVNLKLFLSIATFFSVLGLLGFTMFVSLSKLSITLFCFCFITYGFGQSKGFPACTSVLGNWLQASRRAMLLGLWGASSDNLGNITGQQIGKLLIDKHNISWTYVIIIVSLLMMLLTLILWKYVEVHPKDIKTNYQGKQSEYQIDFEEPEAQTRASSNAAGSDLESPPAPVEEITEKIKGIKFMEALKTPGVIKYSFVNACIKGSTYGILFWLPDYLHTVMGFGSESATIATMYEVGQFVGAIGFGYFVDRLGKRSTLVASGLYVAACLFILLAFLGKSTSVAGFLVILFFAGVAFGGPQVIVGSVVSFDLCEKASAKKEVKSLSTILGIVNGSGSIAAAAVQIIIPRLKSKSFYFYFGLCCLAAILLTSSAIRELRKKKDFTNEVKSEAPSPVTDLPAAKEVA